MGLHVVMFQPEIPANTGNVARSCAATGTTLHLIRPLGFSEDDKMLKRAGLDYWEHVTIFYNDSLQELFRKYPEGEFYFISTHGMKSYTAVDYSKSDNDIFFVFGSESKGLPMEIIKDNINRCLRIPTNQDVRPLNVSNAAAILIYEALRQQNYPQLS